MLVKRTVEKRRARVLKTRPQVRKTFPSETDLRSLARSVIKRQLHPFIILSEDVILDGECRWRGLMLENPEFEVDVIVVERELAPSEVCELQMISAMHSTSLSAYDQAVACKEWMEQNPGATAKELAAKIDRDPSMISRLNSLWNNIPEVIRAAEAGSIGPKAWHQISLVSPSDARGLLEMYLAGTTSATQIAELSRKARKPASAGASVNVRRLRCALQSGITVVFTGEAISLDTALDAMKDLSAELRRAIEQRLDAKTVVRVLADKAKKG